MKIITELEVSQPEIVKLFEQNFKRCNRECEIETDLITLYYWLI
jgi:hypothetical protein